MKTTKNYKKTDCPYLEENCPKDGTDMLTCTCPKFLAYMDARDENVIKEILNELNIQSKYDMGIMLEMQSHFASKFHNIKDLSNREIDKWTDKYLTCIIDEVTEAEEFLDIYPERIKLFNLKEFTKEIVDILHFFMDGMLVCGMTYEDLCKHYYQLNDIETSEKDVLKLAMEIEDPNVDKDDKFLYLLNYIVRDCRLIRQNINWKHWKKINDNLDKESMFKGYALMFKHLIQLFKLCGVETNKQLRDIYVHKNVENILRQKYGY